MKIWIIERGVRPWKIIDNGSTPKENKRLAKKEAEYWNRMSAYSHKAVQYERTDKNGNKKN